MRSTYSEVSDVILRITYSLAFTNTMLRSSTTSSLLLSYCIVPYCMCEACPLLSKLRVNIRRLLRI